jgi:anti-sigma regulatory factor (Ser/Thr protein kinase)
MELLCLPPRPVLPAFGEPLGRACGVASEAADDIVLAVNEAAANAILYG